MSERPRFAPRFHSPAWRAGNALASVLAKLGIGPIHLLTTQGRASGRRSTVPVVPVDEGGKRWLVAPYGAVHWVHNARASRHVSMRYGATTQEFGVREVAADEAAPVLKRYVTVAPKARSQFDASEGDPAERFHAEAARHPVFELVDVGS